MYYIRHKSKVSKRTWITILSVSVLLIVIIANAYIKDIMSNAAQIQAQNLFSEALARAVNELTGSEDFGLTDVKTNETGEVTSVLTDTAGLNRIKAQLTVLLMDELGKMESEPATVRAGTLTGIELLAGLGPEVEMRFELRGGVKTNIESEFTESGINMSLHRINCTISADYYIILPGFKFSTELSSTVPMSESIIVGNVPDAYTYVVGDESDTIGKIFDYAHLEP